jgi:GNAT superfamily N-acetyltransferase
MGLLDGKVAIITGASKGIGRALSLRFAREGSAVVCAARSADLVKATVASDKAAAPFLESHGYKPWDTCLVFQRHLDREIQGADGRFPALRRRYNIRVTPKSGPRTWWKECILGSLEPWEFTLEENLTYQPVARAEIWEMEGFSWRWGMPAVGLLELTVQENLRRQGLGKYFLATILKYLQDQYFGIIEVQTMERNQAAVKLYQSLGFEQVDVGRVYQRVMEMAPIEMAGT